MQMACAAKPFNYVNKNLMTFSTSPSTRTFKSMIPSIAFVNIMHKDSIRLIQENFGLDESLNVERMRICLQNK